MTRQKREWWGLLFISPWLIGFLVFTAGPMIASLILSFCKYNIATVKYAGLSNYQRLLTNDPLFWKALLNTATYTLWAVPLGLTGSLLLAVLLNQKIKARGLFRALFYIPTLVPAAAASYLWRYLLNAEYGLLNTSLANIGIAGPDWLGSTKWAMPSMILMSLWGIGGGRMIIFLAGLQNISSSLYEAAAIDGASRLQQFRHVTMPMLTPMIFFNMILGIIGSFQVFTQAFLMTGGGPDNSTLFSALYLFRVSFQQLHMGYASAMAWLLFIILAILTAIQFFYARKWVHYEEAAR